MNTKPIILALLLITFASCKSHERILYMQERENSEYVDSVKHPLPEAVIREGDLLTITVNTNTPEAAIPFNLPLLPGGRNINMYDLADQASLSSSGLSMQNYLVDTQGKLTFPVIGELQVAGLTKSELVKLMKEKIYPRYLNEEPIILVRFANYRITVLGEVVRPGTYNINNERATIFEALSLAGDMTIYGKRANLVLVREIDGLRTTHRLDMRDINLVHSPYYYLQQNDVLYVEPNGPKQRSSNIGSAESISISIVGTLISLSTLLINILK